MAFADGLSRRTAGRTPDSPDYNADLEYHAGQIIALFERKGFESEFQQMLAKARATAGDVQALASMREHPLAAEDIAQVLAEAKELGGKYEETISIRFELLKHIAEEYRDGTINAQQATARFTRTLPNLMTLLIMTDLDHDAQGKSVTLSEPMVKAVEAYHQNKSLENTHAVITGWLHEEGIDRSRIFDALAQAVVFCDETARAERVRAA